MSERESLFSFRRSHVVHPRFYNFVTPWGVLAWQRKRHGWGWVVSWYGGVR